VLVEKGNPPKASDATKWYNSNNRGRKPTDNKRNNVFSPERVESKQRSSIPAGLEINMATGFPRVSPVVIQI